MSQLATSTAANARVKPLTGVITRIVDMTVALVLLVLASPLCLWRIVRAPSGAFCNQNMTGRHQRRFSLWRGVTTRAPSDLFTLVNVLNGSMSLAGPRVIAADIDPSNFSESHFALRPGLFSLAATRETMGLAFGDEAQLDDELLKCWSLRTYASIIAKGFLARIVNGDAPRASPDEFKLFGVRIDNWTMEAALDWICAADEDSNAKAERKHEGKLRRKQFAFVNPDCLNSAYANADYSAALAGMDCVFPDGSGIRLACRLLGINQRANVNGTDMFPLLCDRMAKNGTSLYLLGAQLGVADAVADNMCARFPDLKIAGVRDGYFDVAETEEVIAAINASGAGVLLVAFGAPRQETWLHQHASELQVPVAAGVGGLFDFFSGRISRAPMWMRETGLEWIWRLAQEPGRMWRRYILGNPLFVARVLAQRWQSRR